MNNRNWKHNLLAWRRYGFGDDFLQHLLSSCYFHFPSILLQASIHCLRIIWFFFLWWLQLAGRGAASFPNEKGDSTTPFEMKLIEEVRKEDREVRARRRDGDSPVYGDRGVGSVGGGWGLVIMDNNVYKTITLRASWSPIWNYKKAIPSRAKQLHSEDEMATNFINI